MNSQKKCQSVYNIKQNHSKPKQPLVRIQKMGHQINYSRKTQTYSLHYRRSTAYSINFQKNLIYFFPNKRVRVLTVES